MTGLFQLRLDRRAVTSIECGLIAGMLVAALTLAPRCFSPRCRRYWAPSPPVIDGGRC